jgi:hypothetical protein
VAAGFEHEDAAADGTDAEHDDGHADGD